MSAPRAVFLDRDGVIDELVRDPETGLAESPLHAADVRLLDGAGAAVAALAREGFRTAIVSNQPAAAKDRVSLAGLLAVHRQVLALLAGEGARVDGSRLCPHHPDGVVPGLARRCACRKPAPGMLLEMGAELAVDLSASWMVGDTDADVRAGAAAGCRTVLVEHPGSAHKRSTGVSPDLRARDLADAARQIVQAGI